MNAHTVLTPDQILNQVGQQVGIAELRFNEYGVCSLDLGDRFVHLELDRPTLQLSLHATVAELSVPAPARLLDIMMRANYFTLRTAGATLGLDGVSGTVVLYLRWDASVLTFEKFIERFEAFVEALDYWALRLRNEISADPAPHDTIASADRRPPAMMIQG